MTEQRRAYKEAMRNLQRTARELYRAYALAPSAEGRILLQWVAELLREVTQRAHRHVAVVGIVQVDQTGTVIRRSIA